MMTTRLIIDATLDYAVYQPTDMLLQIEVAANLPEQTVEHSNLELSPCEHVQHVAAHDAIGERVWIRTNRQFQAHYRATVTINRTVRDVGGMAAVPPYLLPGEANQYLLDSLYCPALRFGSFVEAEFGHLQGGARIAAMRDWITRKFAYVPGSSNATTTALDTFVMRQGVCRDFAHLMVTFARASLIPARIASVYALGVKPQDFHAVAEVFLDAGNGFGEWHLVDATGMSDESRMAKIGVGRDAADISFLTVFGSAFMQSQSVMVSEG